LVDVETVGIENHMVFKTTLQSACDWINTHQMELTACTVASKDRQSTSSMTYSIKVNFQTFGDIFIVLKQLI